MAKKGITTDKLRLLLENGFNVKPELYQMVKHREYEEAGIVELWKCVPCNYEYSSPLPLSGVDCPRQHVMKCVWRTGEV